MFGGGEITDTKVPCRLCLQVLRGGVEVLRGDLQGQGCVPPITKGFLSPLKFSDFSVGKYSEKDFGLLTTTLKEMEKETFGTLKQNSQVLGPPCSAFPSSIVTLIYYLFRNDDCQDAHPDKQAGGPPLRG